MSWGDEEVKNGFVALLGMLGSFLMLVPFALMGKYLNWGLGSSLVFSPLYYFLFWRLGMHRSRDWSVWVLGIVPAFNMMGCLAYGMFWIWRMFGKDLEITNSLLGEK